MRMQVTLNNQDVGSYQPVYNRQYNHNPYATYGNNGPYASPQQQYQQHQEDQYQHHGQHQQQHQEQQQYYYSDTQQEQYQSYDGQEQQSAQSDFAYHVQPPTSHIVPAPQQQAQYQQEVRQMSYPKCVDFKSQPTSSNQSFGAVSVSSHGNSDDVESENTTLAPSTTTSTLNQEDSTTGTILPRPMGTARQNRGRVDPSRFKTEQCSYHVRGEPCPYTPYCAFAHGDTEKRSRRRNVREGVTKVNTLPRTLVYHEVWVQTTKYTRKTGPAEPVAPNAAVAAPAKPSFMKK